MKTPLTKSECQRLVETTQKLTEEIVALRLTVQRAHLLQTHQAKLPAGIEKTVGKKALYHDKLSARTARKWKRETVAKMRANGISILVRRLHLQSLRRAGGSGKTRG